MDSNFVLFMNPHEPYRTCHPQSCGDFGSTLVLSPEFIQELLAAYLPRVLEKGSTRFPILTRAISNQSYLTQRVVITRLSRRDPDSLALEETCLRAAGRLVREMSRSGNETAARPARSSGRSGRRALVEAVRDILNRRFREAVLLRDLAGAVGCSPYHLCRTFRRETTLPVHRYLNRLRLRAAIESAADCHTDLTRLALDSGFSSHSHFSTAFRREFGFPPARLRQLVASRKGLQELQAAF